MWRVASSRSVAKNRSATIPTKNGEIIAATAVVPKARPICSPEKRSVSPSHVPIVTDHAPQTKYCRNIMEDSLSRTVEVIAIDPLNVANLERLVQDEYGIVPFFGGVFMREVARKTESNDGLRHETIVQFLRLV